MPIKNTTGIASQRNEIYRFAGGFLPHTTPTLLDSSEAIRVRDFIENIVFRSMFNLNTGSPAQNNFQIDFTDPSAVNFKLDLQTDLIYDTEPTLSNDLELNGNDIRFREFSRLRQWRDRGFQFHPQNFVGDTPDDLLVILKLFVWDSDTPYHIGFKTPSASNLSGSSSLDADNGLVWTLPHEDGTSGQVIQTDGSRVLSFVDGGSGQNFGIIAVAGQTDVEADQSKDTLTLVAGTGISLTTDASADSVTITNTDYGGGALTVKEQDGTPTVNNVTTIKFNNGSVTDDGSGVVSVSNGGPNVGDGTVTVTSPSSLRFSNDCVTESPTGVARIKTGRPIDLQKTGNGVIVGTSVSTETASGVGEENYQFIAADGMKLSALGFGAIKTQLQLEVLTTEVETDTNTFNFRCGDQLAFKGGNGISTSYTVASYPYWVNFDISDDVMQSINSIAAVGNNFDLLEGEGITLTGGTAEITIDANVADIQGGTNISVSQDGTTFTIDNDKSAIVKSVDPDPDTYVAVYCDESPEVRFNDILTIENITEYEFETKLCKEYVHSCEEKSIKVVGHAASDPCLVGFNIVGDTVVCKFSTITELPKFVNLHLSGIRKGRAGKRHERKSLKQAVQNNSFWGAAYEK